MKTEPYEYYSAQVGGLIELELEEVETSLEPHQLTDQDVDLLYLEIS